MSHGDTYADAVNCREKYATVQTPFASVVG